MSKFDKILVGALQMTCFGLILYQLIYFLQGEWKEGGLNLIIMTWFISLLIKIPTKPSEKG